MSEQQQIIANATKKSRVTILLVALVAFAVGFFAGREHFRAELRDSFIDAFDTFDDFD